MPDDKDRPTISAGERAIAALNGYTVGAAVVLPFDRIKSLMQVSASHRQQGALASARQVMAKGGVAGLYQGGTAHMLIAPFTIFYYSLYDELLSRGRRATTETHGNGGHPLLPLGAAIVARSIETAARQPLELVRTIMQTSSDASGESLPGVLAALRRQSVGCWFRGMQATLLRDVPFSATYWLLYETAKRRLVISESALPSPTARTFVQSLACGGAAGMAAAVLIAPLDVIKTVRQHQIASGSAASYAAILSSIRATPRVAFAGLGPRLVRIPTGLAAMMAGIEVTRLAFEQRRAGAQREQPQQV